MKAQFPEVFALTPQEKIQLLGELWDSLARNPQDVPMPAWQLDEIRRRKEAHLANPQAALTWEQAKKQILGGQ